MIIKKGMILSSTILSCLMLNVKGFYEVKFGVLFLRALTSSEYPESD
jgi:hypothetical protein